MTQLLINLPDVAAPARQKMGYEAYRNFAGEAQIVEWVDGEVIIHVPPFQQHQEIVVFLAHLLDVFVQLRRLGKIVVAPFEVKLWSGGPAREPDIFFVAQENLVNLSDQRFTGGPDLIVEVISPSSVTIDRIEKFSEYERAGVKEYWVVDPRAYQRQLDFYVLAANGRFQPASPDETGRYHAAALPGFWLDVTWLLRPELPNPQLALAEIMMSADGVPDEIRETYRTLHRLLSQ